jgi:Ran GTPase-activating protein (RanGAP) involved in mRNA processing and transport
MREGVSLSSALSPFHLVGRRSLTVHSLAIMTGRLAALADALLLCCPSLPPDSPLIHGLREEEERGQATRVESLSLKGLGIGDKELKVVVDAVLSEGIHILELHLPNNEVGDDGAREIARLLRECCDLEKLDLRGNKIERDGCKIICEAAARSGLVSLDLSWNPLGPDGGKIVAETVLVPGGSLKELSLARTGMGEAGIVAVSVALRGGACVLEKLDVSGISMNDHLENTCYHIARACATNPRLQSLNVANCGLGEEGGIRLSEALMAHPSMRHVNLSGNRLGITGVTAMSKLLGAEECGLTELDLSANGCGDQGAEAMGVALARSKGALRSLDLRRNKISDSGLRDLAEGLRLNVALHEVHLWGNDFGQDSLSAFKDLVQGHLTACGTSIDFRVYESDGKLLAAQLAG